MQWFVSQRNECHHGPNREWKNIVSSAAYSARMRKGKLINLQTFSRLLDILAGRKNKSGLTGRVLVNGQPQPTNFKCISGYVVQVNLINKLNDNNYYY